MVWINRNRYASKSLLQGGEESNPGIPSVFWIFKSADFQERESLMSFIHAKRILMPELIGWPLRKEILLPPIYFYEKKRMGFSLWSDRATITEICLYRWKSQRVNGPGYDYLRSVWITNF